MNLTPKAAQNALHVDTYFKADVSDAPDPDVHVWFDLAVSGGCQPDGSLTLSIDPVDVKVDASPELALGPRVKLMRAAPHTHAHARSF